MRNSAGENEETGAGAEAGAWLWAPAPRGVECSGGLFPGGHPLPGIRVYIACLCVCECVCGVSMSICVCECVSLGRWVSGDEAHRLYWHGDIF